MNQLVLNIQAAKFKNIHNYLTKGHLEFEHEYCNELELKNINRSKARIINQFQRYIIHDTNIKSDATKENLFIFSKHTDIPEINEVILGIINGGIVTNKPCSITESLKTKSLGTKSNTWWDRDNDYILILGNTIAKNIYNLFKLDTAKRTDTEHLKLSSLSGNVYTDNGKYFNNTNKTILQLANEAAKDVLRIDTNENIDIKYKVVYEAEYIKNIRCLIRVEDINIEEFIKTSSYNRIKRVTIYGANYDIHVLSAAIVIVQDWG